jgi:hypothetical protein
MQTATSFAIVPATRGGSVDLGSDGKRLVPIFAFIVKPDFNSHDSIETIAGNGARQTDPLLGAMDQTIPDLLRSMNGVHTSHHTVNFVGMSCDRIGDSFHNVSPFD